jgi:branched-chain amino acid transport system permease protein
MSSVLVSVLINGVLLGCVYSLFAVGLTISFGMMRVFNVAYGSVVTFAVIEAGAHAAHASLPVTLVLGTVVGGLITGAIQLVAVLPLEYRGLDITARGEATFLTTLAAWLILFGLNVNKLGSSAGGAGNFPSYSLLSGEVSIGSVHVQTGYIVAAVAAIALIAAVWYVIMRTQVGRSLRAIASDFRMAEMLGINVKAYSLGGAVVVGMVAGFAGVLLAGIFLSYDSGFGDTFLLRGFAIVVVAGIGSIGGTLAGGIILGLSESLISYYIGGDWVTTGSALIIAAILIARPNGLFGRQADDRA